MEINLGWKSTLDGKLLWMEDDLQWKTIMDERRPSMEDNLQQAFGEKRKIAQLPPLALEDKL